MKQAWLALLAFVALATLADATGKNLTRPPTGDLVGNAVVNPDNPVCPRGCKGEPGLVGRSGREGRQGPRGPPGMPGVAGYSGWSEWAGWKDNYQIQAVKGVRGDQGPVGPNGAPGSDGSQGQPGNVGLQGPLGPPGRPGDRGQPGVPGGPGGPGAPGRQGPRGADGPAGLTGDIGEPGPLGDKGAQGDEGLAGAQGSPGSAGANGAPGAKGTRGDRGLPGSQGQKGFEGSMGETGVPGFVGEPGQLGETAQPGDKGEQGEPGQQGPRGEPGEMGAKGERGPYIEKIGLNETTACSASTNGKVKYDPYLKKLYFCNGNRWLCVKSRVCDEPCRVSRWGDWGACTATCGDAGVTMRSRTIVSEAGVQGAACPALTETRPCRGLPPCTCPDPGLLQNGQRFGSDLSIGASVRWQCQSGYHLEGSSASICLMDSSTNTASFTTKPICVAAICPTLAAPLNGQVDVASPAVYQSRATFTCSAGYTLVGSATLFCLANGNWDAQPPSCRPNSCADPGTPSNGGRNTTSLTLNTVVQYYCNPGYELRGTSVITCQVSGFSGSAPTCEAITCPTRDPPVNGRVDSTGNAYGSSARYSCNDGYSLVGQAIAVCQLNGQWSADVPTCQLIDCGDPGTPDNGRRSGDATVYQSVLRFTCLIGYSLSGSPQRRCQANGMWSGSQPTCQIINCGDPGTPDNGQRSDGSRFVFNSQVTFTCNSGYVLQGSQTRTCQASGQWSGTQPICRAIMCDDPGIPTNGGRDGSSLTLGSVVTYFCNPGYSLFGDSRRTCQANGQFDGSLPQCIPIKCDNPGRPDNGFRMGDDFSFTQQVNFSCDVGYQLSGSQIRVCLANGRWSGTAAMCTLIDCRDPGTPANGGRALAGTTYGQDVTYTCNTGYTLAGAQRRTCQANGFWSMSLPECRLVQCCDLVAPRNGSMVGVNRNFNDSIGFACNSGFLLIGSVRRQCLANGSWSGTPPSCEPVLCTDPGVPGNGSRLEISYQVGGQSVFQCNVGFRLVGSRVLTCLETAEWDAPLPRCQLITCPDPGIPGNGSRQGSNFSYSASVSFTCNENFVLNGSPTLRCLISGSWSASRPTCDPSCVVSAYSSWGTCSATCNDGVEIRTRVITQLPSGAGQPCPALVDSRSCRIKPCVLCENTHEEGAIVFRIRTRSVAPATDVIIVVDESESMEGEHRWLPGMIQSLDTNLRDRSIGTDPRRPNLFALVGFGLRRTPTDETLLYPHFYTANNGKPVFTAGEFPDAASKLVARGDIEDGYLAIAFGINNITWPNGTQALRKNQLGIAQNLIFISDEDRDILPIGGPDWNRRLIKILLRSNNVVPNFVVDQRFWVGDRPAIGIDYKGEGFLADGAGGYTATTENVRQGTPYRNTKKDYTGLGVDRQLRGAAWDIELLRRGGTTSASFTAAFTDVKTAEIVRQVNQCTQCTCVDDGATGDFQCQRAANQTSCCILAGGSYANGICNI